MNHELAEHISLLAAPIFAALLAPYVAGGGREISAEGLQVLRRHAIIQAQALWLAVLDTE